jgi:RNA polymerase sigma-70 factor (ECF subfamily)
MTAPADTLIEDLRNCRRGDEIAARRLYASVGGSMELVALAVTNDRASALDVVQQALLRVLEAPLEQVDEVRDVLPWLLKITRNVAINSVRSDSRRTARERLSYVLQHGSNENGAAQDRNDLNTAIASLTLEHREVIILRHFIGLTWVQIGHAIGLTDSACAARHKTALEQLRTAISRTSAIGAKQC